MIYIHKKSGAFLDMKVSEFDELQDDIKKVYRRANDSEVERFKTLKKQKSSSNKASSTKNETIVEANKNEADSDPSEEE